MSNAKRRRESKAQVKAERLGTPAERLQREVNRLVNDTLSGKFNSTRSQRRGHR